MSGKYIKSWAIYESLKSDIFKNIDNFIKPHIKQQNISGVNVGIFKNGETILKKSWGLASIEMDVKLKPDHIFEIASVTKQFTGAAIMHLVETGKISLDDSITKWISVDTDGKKITIRNLVEHTSGLGFGLPGDPRLKNSITKNGRKVDLPWDDLGISLDDLLDKDTRHRILKLSSGIKSEFEPGFEQSYSNFGYFLLGLIIEKVSGKTYEDYIQKNIFDKAGMKSSYCGNYDGIVKDKVSGYDRKNLKGEGLSNDMILVKAKSANLNVPFSAGCISSNLEDMNKWNQFIHGGKFLKEETYKEYIQVAQLSSGELTKYAKGLCIIDWKGKKLFFHSGGIPGFSSMSFYFPEEKVSIVVLINTEGFNIPRFSKNFDTNLSFGLNLIIANYAANLLFDKEDSDFRLFGIKEVVFKGNYNDYTGLYKSSTFVEQNRMTIEIINSNGLKMKLNGAKKSAPLYYVGDDSFSDGDSILKFTGKEVHLIANGGYIKLKK